ncbi:MULTISPECIES: Smr/MutS family protein [Halocynthiibacter]|uniref:Smr/MutS family protein n=1 Tax=Halocynthiibacter halioticoli TaxID=2986804 RepID=A0AAE3J0A8_9RHOB|nr:MULTISPECIES: Smr/MutS family protein [Halocynthiibacter]MCV6825622.1 Smr/MutS family protein [Halocynthiibacter halioticoli]MCW4058623.1 Smr/MutS family protein [Halocynthiibacter sp. SDUM655004]
MKKPRGLHPDEEALWRVVAEQAEPLHPKQPLTNSGASIPDPKRKPVRINKSGLRAFNIGEKAPHRNQSHDLKPALSDRIGQAPVHMDHKTFGKMKRGRIIPEGKLDLHGKTMAQAHPALNRFILDAYADGKRLVLVVTGKGKHRDEPGPIPVPFGVLKHQVPQWLMMAPLRSAVLQVSEAHLKHGGSGAYYVYLRRHR